MQISQNADLARLDDVLAEAREITRAGAAGVDRRGDAGRPAKLLGVNAERGSTPINVGVQIDQAGGDDQRGVADAARLEAAEFGTV